MSILVEEIKINKKFSGETYEKRENIRGIRKITGDKKL